MIAQDRAEIGCNTNSQPTILPLVGCPSQSDSKTKAGWTVGWGSEFGLTRNVSVKSEIMYFDLGTDRYNMGGISADIQRSGLISTVGFTTASVDSHAGGGRGKKAEARKASY